MCQSVSKSIQLIYDLRPITRRISPCVAGQWAEIYRSCPIAQNVTSSTISNTKSGKRRISRQYVVTYADIQHPHMPSLLRSDTQNALEMMHTTVEDRRWMMSTIIAFVKSSISPLDHTVLLPPTIPSMPTNADVVNLLTSVAWYCLCYDVAGC